MTNKIILYLCLLIISLISLCKTHLEFGSLLDHVCFAPSGRKGVCLFKEDCLIPTPMSPGEYFYPPSPCGFHGNIELFCCIKIRRPSPPPINRPVFQIPIEDQLEVSSPFINFECGIINEKEKPGMRRIWFPNEIRDTIGNPQINNMNQNNLTVNARKSLAKYTALLAIKRSDGEINPFCTGVILNERWILTAAHCLEDSELCTPSIPCVIRLGEYDLSKPDESLHEDFEISQIKTHEEWRPLEAYHDLALVQVNRIITFQENRSPVCLPWGTETAKNLIGTDITFTGWSRMFFASNMINPILQEGTVTVIDVNQCQNAYNSMQDFTIKWPNNMSEQDTLCAIDTDGRMDPCFGNSGGPAVYISPNNRAILGGIISLGSGCGNNIPGVYVPINQVKYLSWIKSIAFNSNL